MLRITCALVWTALILGNLADTASAADEARKPARILMITQSRGFTHGSVNRGKESLAPAEIAVTQIGQTSGLFKVDCSQDMDKDLTKENLQNYDIVWFYTTGGFKQINIPEERLQYFLNDWLKQKGHGFIGSHSATDTLGDYEPYWDMIGGTFNGHPWGSGETVTITVHDTEHPATRAFGPEFQIKDEIYQYKNWQPEKVCVLMSLNMAKCNTKKPYHVPVAWVKNYGDGRVFYSNLGHNPETWANPAVRDSLLGGVKWVLGLEAGNSKPNPELSKAQEAKAKADTEAAK